ncbi:MAG: hypothetical protein HYU86_10515 [Chloroflexi bacterium]|nr:hypothetical protein [Chloroflexota bacterium]
MPVLRLNGPYIWVTWLTKLLIGTNSCEWASWFRAQHESGSWDKVPSTFDWDAWRIEHTALLGTIRQQLEMEGKTVFTEKQNSFTLQGKTAALGGQPDLIAISGSRGTILDAKAGAPHPSHSMQVKLYMYAAPRALRQYSGMTFDGKLVYKDHEIPIPSSAINGTFIKNLSELIRRIASSNPAVKVPSPVECKFCNITQTDCPDRVAEDTIEGEETSDF